MRTEITEKDLKVIKDNVYPNSKLIEIFTDSEGFVWVSLATRDNILGKWNVDIEDFSSLVGVYSSSISLWVVE